MKFELYTPTIARRVPMKLNAGTASRLRTQHKEGKLTYIRLNIQTPCPPRGAVPVNQGCCGRLSTFTYDYRGLVTSVTLDAGSPGQLIYLYGYDEMGNLIKQTDANGNVTQFQYDQLGRRTQRMLPDGSIETTVYADVPVAPGSPVSVQQTAVTDFRGRTIVTTEDGRAF
jgi:YD repeat-containing protein